MKAASTKAGQGPPPAPRQRSPGLSRLDSRVPSASAKAWTSSCSRPTVVARGGGTYISLMLESGAPLPYVMDEVGHADSKTTLEIYAQVQKRARTSMPRSIGCSPARTAA
jgi:hypothetical protein